MKMICPPAMMVVVKLVTDVHCAEKSLDIREFTFLENFQREVTGVFSYHYFVDKVGDLL